MLVNFRTGDMTSYRQFLRLKKLPTYSWQGSAAVIPDEYAHLLNGTDTVSENQDIDLSSFLFDYQSDIAKMAIRKRKFCVFADCGLGKTAILLEFSKHAAKNCGGKRVLIVSPLMVIPQTISEANKFYPHMRVRQIAAAHLQEWLNSNDATIGITNYEAIREGLEPGKLGALILDEASMLKSHYGSWGTRLIELGKGIEWKLALTGTPAPNDRIEYANQSVFCDHFRTVNEFLARYFVNRGETQNRWEIKPHALKPFYRDLSHWCIFLTSPATYGWKDNCGTIPPINIHIDHIELTGEQRKATRTLTGGLFVNGVGGIGSRGKLSQLAKGRMNGEDVATNKPAFIRQMIDSWPDESTIIWCRYNQEQEQMEATFPEAASISGDTPHETRIRLIDEFKAGTCKVLISKPKILGFGLNLQIATRQVFSGLQDSYEEFYQAVKRSNRIGSTRPLNVHIPITELEEPMIQTVLEKAKRVQFDTEEQERLFLEMRGNACV